MLLVEMRSASVASRTGFAQRAAGASMPPSAASRRTQAPCRPAFGAQPSRSAPAFSNAVRGARQLQRCNAAPAPAPAPAPVGKLISSTEVPAFIPRDDMIDQLHKWAIAEAGTNGLRNFGMPMKVEPTYREGTLWGFKVGIFKEGVHQTDIGVRFDDTTTQKYDWVGRDNEGFPTLEGEAKTVMGKNIEIMKLDNAPVSEELRSAIRAFCTALVSALNKYYAFGSVFIDPESA